MTAQRILTAHLRSFPPNVFWDGIDIDLTEAYLDEFEFFYCHVQSAGFNGAQFSGNAWFSDAQFNAGAWFNGAQFGGPAWFGCTRFHGTALFKCAQFTGKTAFVLAHFGNDAHFEGAVFKEAADFAAAQFDKSALFDGARGRTGMDHSWPAGWTDSEVLPAEDEAGWAYLIRVDDSTQ